MLSIKKNLFQRFFLIISLVTFGVTSYVWINCVQLACTESLIDNYISPLKMTGMVFVIFSLAFLFLPAKYFNAWFKYVFIWAFPLSFVLVETLPVETGWLTISKTDIVQLLGMIFGAITILFTAVQWFRSKK